MSSHDAEVVSQQTLGEWVVLRLKAPGCAAAARPGHSLMLDDGRAMLSASIMRADARTGMVEVLYAADGAGPVWKAGDRLSTEGPQGENFLPTAQRPITLLIGDERGIAPMVFLTESLRSNAPAQWQLLVLLGAMNEFPFRTRPSTILVPGMPDGVIACMPMLDEWSVPSRLANTADAPGCFDGSVVELASIWLRSLDASAMGSVELVVSGGAATIEAANALADDLNIQARCISSL
jgi:dihydroorotate dehydrogenase electron transfer subunit